MENHTTDNCGKKMEDKEMTSRCHKSTIAHIEKFLFTKSCMKSFL